MGPSMASGSQVWSGSCADLAKAPTRSRRQAATSVPSFRLNASPASSNTVRKSSEETLSRIRNAATTSATSPITLITNALMPAATAVSRRYQKRDQQVGGRAHERPPDDQDHEVRRQDQQQHREDEEVQVGEVARVAAVAAHVGDRVEVDQERHARHHEAHEHRQRVDQDREVDAEVGGGRVGPRAVHQLAVVLGVVVQVEQRADRGEERQEDRARCRSSRAAGPAARASRGR